MDQDKTNVTQWTPQTIRENVGNWSLAGDAGLLLYLQNFSQKLTLRTRETITNVDNLFTSLDDTKIALANVTNDFINLHHTQFIESRVYEEDETITETKTENIKNVNEPEQSVENVELMRKVIQDGLDIMNKHFERVEVPNSDSEDESEGPSIIVRPKKLYSDRPLPYVIGSDEWNASDHVGLRRHDESSESSTDDEEQIESDDNSLQKVHETTSESSFDMLSRDDKDIFNPSVSNKDLSYSNSTRQDNIFESSSTSSDVEPREKKETDDKFISELAAKLGNVVQDNKTKLIRDDSDVYGAPQKSTKEPTKPSKPYSDGGLFAEEPPPLDEVDKTDLFGATMGQNKYLASGGGLFDDIDNDEDSLWSGTRNTKEAVTDKNDQANGNIAKEPVSKVTKITDEIRPISKGLFDDDSDIDDLFTAVNKTTKPMFPETKPSTVVPFIDDQPPPTDTTATNITKRKPPVGGVSIFGNQDSLTESISEVLKTSKHQSNSVPEEAKPKPAEEKPKKYISLFSDDESASETKKFESIFDDDDEDNSFDFLISKKLSGKTTDKNTEAPEKVNHPEKNDSKPSPLPTKKDLFVDDQIPDIPDDLNYSDDDSDIFQTNTKKIDSENNSTSFFSNEPPPLDNNNTDSSNEASSLKKNTINLFNDIDDNLFQQKLKENVEDTPTKRKIIDLFGDSTLQENIFESIKKDSDVSKETSPPLGVAESKKDRVDNIPLAKPTVLPKPGAPTAKTDNIPPGNVKNLTQKLSNAFEQKENQNITNNNETRGKVSHNLNINVNALLPGSVRPKLNKSDSIEEKTTPEMTSPSILSPTTDTPPQIVKSISFDEPVDNVETLQSLTQERVRIPVKRRPSTRRARQQALRASMIENDNDLNEEIAANDETDHETKPDVDTKKTSETEDLLNGNKNIDTPTRPEDCQTQKPAADIFETKNDNLFDNVQIGTKIENVLNDFLKNDDIFGENFLQKKIEKSKREENNNFAKELFSGNILENTKTTQEDEEDLFKSTSTATTNTIISGTNTNTITPTTNSTTISSTNTTTTTTTTLETLTSANKNSIMNKSTDSLISSKSNQSFNTLPSFLLDDNDDDDLFSNLGLKKESRLSEKRKDESKTTAASLFDGDDDEDDIFAALNKKNQSKKLFQPQKSTLLDDDTSLFSTNKETVRIPEPSSTVVKKPPVVEDDDDVSLFKSSNTTKSTTLFDDGDSGLITTKKETLKTSKPSLNVKVGGSLFDDDDEDDDLFGASKTKFTSKSKESSGSSVMTKESGSRVKTVPSTKKVSLFDDDDDDDDLFGSSSLQKDNKKKPVPKTETPSGKIIKPASQVVFEDPLMFGDN